VVWKNDDAVPHTVTSSDGVFDSGIFDPGGSFAFTFNEPGSFPYLCQLHPQMQGTVTAESEPVVGVQADQPAAGATPAPAETSEPAASVGSAVSIVDFAFEPATLEISAGETVVWTNDGLAPHTVTGDFADSGVLDPGQTFSHTFDSEGAFDYFCAIHPDMVGSVSVGAGQAAPATPMAASGTETTAPEGVWLLELIPDNDVILGGQQALIAFHASGMLEADFAAAPGTGIPASIVTSGRGEWVVRDGVWGFSLAALINDKDQRFAATVMFDGEGQLAADGASLEGTFDFELIAPDGLTIGQGAGTFSGQHLPLDP
jgi:plastocyanin